MGSHSSNLLQSHFHSLLHSSILSLSQPFQPQTIKMKFFAAAALFAGVLAMPAAELEDRTNTGPVCCATDVLGVICLDGEPPNETPRDGRHFRDICAKEGQQAKCCVLPVVGQGVLCNDVVGF